MAPKRPDASGLPRLPIDVADLASTLKPIASEPRLRLLHFLAQPRYLEEIASFLGMARQSAQHHVDRLLEIGVIEKRPGQRDTGPVTEYVVSPHRFFALGEDMFRLGTLRRAGSDAGIERTEQAKGEPAHAAGGGGPALVEVHSMERGRVHRLVGPGPWVIGRGDDKDVALGHDPFASGKHAKVAVEAGGHVLIDMYSTNGTSVNWTPLEEGAKRPLAHGDIVGVGKTLFVYWA